MASELEDLKKPFFKEIERKVDEHHKFAELLEDPEG